MRPRVSWMSGHDDSILELLGEKDVALSPKPMHVNLKRNGVSISLRTVHRRIKALKEHELIEMLDGEEGSYYVVTDKGRAYLRGEIDASELEDS